MSGFLADTLSQFGTAVDFVAGTLGVDEQTIQTFDTAVGTGGNLSSDVTPAEAIAAAAVATAAVFAQTKLALSQVRRDMQ